MGNWRGIPINTKINIFTPVEFSAGNKQDRHFDVAKLLVQKVRLITVQGQSNVCSSPKAARIEIETAL
jgi:hypothetical protein